MQTNAGDQKYQRLDLMRWKSQGLQLYMRTCCRADILEIFGLTAVIFILHLYLFIGWKATQGKKQSWPSRTHRTCTHKQQLADCSYPITMIIAVSAVLSPFFILDFGRWVKSFCCSLCLVLWTIQCPWDFLLYAHSNINTWTTDTHTHIYAVLHTHWSEPPPPGDLPRH